MVAASEGKHEILDHLMEAGADSEVKSKVDFASSIYIRCESACSYLN